MSVYVSSSESEKSSDGKLYCGTSQKRRKQMRCRRALELYAVLVCHVFCILLYS